MARISLCSFTYNDAPLLHGLLAAVPAWPTRPDEIILVDDGSDEPFALTPEEQKLPVRLIRLPENQGFTRAKHAGLNAATGGVIVSLDCDVSLSGDFLGNAARILQDERVGLVGPNEKGATGEDIFSKYLDIYGLASSGDENNETGFVNGPALAIRRALWEEIGGYGGHKERRGSDQYLSRLLKSKGLKLRLDPDSHCKSARVLSRQAFCRRQWLWSGKVWLEGMNQGATLPGYIYPLLMQMRLRCIEIASLHNPAWVYFELLQITHLCLEFCNALGPAGLLPAGAGEDLLRIINGRLAAYPALLRFFKADLLKTGALPLREARAPAPQNNSRRARECDWTAFAQVLDEFAQSSMLVYLEKIGIREIMDDEARIERDFSSY